MRTATTCQSTTRIEPMPAISTVRTKGGQPKVMPRMVTAIKKLRPVAMLPTVARQVIDHQILNTLVHGTWGVAWDPKRGRVWSVTSLVQGLGVSSTSAKILSEPLPIAADSVGKYARDRNIVTDFGGI